MKRDVRMKAEQRKPTLVVTGSRARKTWDEPEDEEEDSELYSTEDSEPENGPQTRRGSTRLLTMIQITACAVILVAAIGLRLDGGEMYQKVREWYFESLNNSIVADSQMEHAKHIVIDLWSNLNASRAESSQAPGSSAPEENGQAGSSSQTGGGENSVSPNGNGAAPNDNGASSNGNGVSPNDNGAGSGTSSEAPSSGPASLISEVQPKSPSAPPASS